MLTLLNDKASNNPLKGAIHQVFRVNREYRISNKSFLPTIRKLEITDGLAISIFRIISPKTSGLLKSLVKKVSVGFTPSIPR
jgi:hypothetical protein